MSNDDKTNVIEILLAAVGLFIQIILAPQIIDLTTGILFGLIIFFELKKKYNLVTAVLSAVVASIFPLALRFITKIPPYSRLAFLSVVYITTIYHKTFRSEWDKNSEFLLIFYFIIFFIIFECISLFVPSLKKGVEPIIKDYLISRGIKYPFYFIFYVGALTIISEMAIEISEKLVQYLQKIIKKIKGIALKNFIKDIIAITLLAALVFYPILYVNLGISQELNTTTKDSFITIENYGEKSFKAIILDDKANVKFTKFIKPNSIEKIDLRNLSKMSNEIILLIYYNDILVHAMKIQTENIKNK